MWRRALRLGILAGGGLTAPGGVVAQSGGAVEVVLIIQTIGGVVLRVLQTGDEALVFVAEFTTHQGRLTHNHYVLTGEAEVGSRAALLAGRGAHTAVGAAGRVLPFPPLGGGLSGRLSFGATFFVICGEYFRFEVLGVSSWWSHHSLPFLEQAGLETVPGAEVVGLVPGHELLHGLQDYTQPEVVEGEVGQTHASDIFGQLLQHLRVLCMHGQDAAGDELSVLSDGKVPRLDPHQVVEGKLQYQTALGANLCKHWLPVLGDHGALITVQGDARVVEGLLGVFEDVVELADAALKHRAEVTRDQRPADRVSLWSIFEAEGERESGIFFKKLCGKGVPPQIVTFLGARLQPLVHLVDPVLGLDHVGRVPPVERSERGRVEGVVVRVGHGGGGGGGSDGGGGAISTSSSG